MTNGDGCSTAGTRRTAPARRSLRSTPLSLIDFSNASWSSRANRIRALRSTPTQAQANLRFGSRKEERALQLSKSIAKQRAFVRRDYRKARRSEESRVG